MKTICFIFFISLVSSCQIEEQHSNAQQPSVSESSEIRAIEERMTAMVVSYGLEADKFDPNLDIPTILDTLRNGKTVDELVDWVAFEDSLKEIVKSVAANNDAATRQPRVSQELRTAFEKASSLNEAQEVMNAIRSRFPYAVIDSTTTDYKGER